jgi:copper transport protein
LIALAALLLCAAPANAHAVLVRSSPTDGARLDRAPSQVTLIFDEPVGLVPGAVRVIGLDGSRADTDAGRLTGAGDTIVIALRPNLPTGSYAVTWRVVSADTHVVTGSIRFGIRVAPSAALPTGPPSRTGGLDVAADAARGVVYAGVVLGFGVSVGVRWLWPWTARRRRAVIGIRVGWLLCLMGTAADLVLMGPRADDLGWAAVGGCDGLGRTLDSHFGHLLTARLMLAAIPAAAAWAARRPPLPALAAGVGVLITVGMTGHEAVGPQVWLALGSAVLHLCAMSVWLGGLLLLTLVVLPRLRSGRAPVGYLAPWSRIAFCCVATLVVTGEYQAWRQVQPVPSLWSTRYGVVLLIKLALVVGMLAAAWRAQRQIAGHGGRGRAGRLRLVSRSVVLEAAIAAGVLVATTVLVSEPPARADYGPALAATAPLGPDTVRVRVDTTRRGREAIAVQAVAADGTPVRAVSVRAVLSSVDAGVAALVVPFDRDPADPTRWHSVDAVAPLPGEWNLALTVNLPGDEAYVTSVPYPVW